MLFSYFNKNGSLLYQQFLVYAPRGNCIIRVKETVEIFIHKNRIIYIGGNVFIVIIGRLMVDTKKQCKTCGTDFTFYFIKLNLILFRFFFCIVGENWEMIGYCIEIFSNKNKVYTNCAKRSVDYDNGFYILLVITDYYKTLSGKYVLIKLFFFFVF